jgi:hypothetical protein
VQYSLFLRQCAQRLMTALMLSGAAAASYGADSYDPHHNQLTIPAITIGGATYSNMVVTVGGILSGPAGTMANGVVDTYDPATKQLTVPAVTVLNGATYYNVVATVTALNSIGGAVGADVYDGTHLTIPTVQVGGAVYENVVIVIDRIVSAVGGMPVNALDQYSIGSNQLMVSAALDQVNSKVYTNAIVTVKSIVSQGGIANSSQLVTEHALTQTGLAIGLASTVLQSQVQVVFASQGGYPTCSALSGGGGVRSGATNGLVTVYYDSACTQPYVSADATLTSFTTNQDYIAETATYYGLTGNVIGTLTLNEVLGETTSAIEVSGLGIFTPATGIRMPVQLGLYCTIPSSTATSATLPCAGGIAQDFPSLGMAVGAVTPLTLQLEAMGPVTFSGSGSTVDAGALGSLTLTAPSTTSMAITGGTQVASYSTSGSAAAFVLFPPTPTGWTLTDPVSGLQLQVSVVSNTVRNLSLTITNPATSAMLATGAIDQSGTGTMTWSNGAVEQVTSWTLGGPVITD